MSADYVRAWLTIAPFDRDELATSDSGKQLLAVIDEWGFDELYELDEDGIPYIELVDNEAAWGTGAFEDKLFPLLKDLSLCYMACDPGSTGWEPQLLVHCPDGTEHVFPTSGGADPIMTLQTWNTLSPKGMRALEEYWDMATRDVVGWVQETKKTLTFSTSPKMSS